MRVAFFSPLPPAKSGIADYSAALLEWLARIAEVESFGERPAAFNRCELRRMRVPDRQQSLPRLRV